MNQHRETLRAELLAAHQRRYAKPAQPSRQPRQQRPRRPVWHFAGAVTAVVLVVTLVVSAVSTNPTPAAADVFSFRHVDDEVIVSIIDTIDNPNAAAAELDAQGFHVILDAVPVPAELVGAVIGVAAEGGTVDTTAAMTAPSLRCAFPPARPGLSPSASAVPPKATRPTERTPYPGMRRVQGQARDRPSPRPNCPGLGASHPLDAGRQQFVPDLDESDIDADAVIIDVWQMAADQVLIQITDGGPIPNGLGC